MITDHHEMYCKLNNQDPVTFWGYFLKRFFKTNRRSTLTTSHIEDIMRIRINGPEIDDFDPVIYTLHWLNPNHLESNDPKTGRESIEKDMHARKSNLF